MADTAVSIVIPVYNSEKTIGPLVRELAATLGPLYRLEIVLVNDGSRDGSDRACIEAYRAHPDIVRYYSLAKNVGEHNAVMAGLNHAHGRFVVIMDDDFQNPVSEVVKLVDYAAANDVDAVYTYYDRKRHAWWRNLGSRFNDKVANIMLGKPRDLYLSSFKLLDAFLVKEIIKYDLPFSYIDGLILRTTDRIGRVKVEHHERQEGRSGYTLHKLVHLWMNMFTNFSILPLRAAMGFGFLFSAIGLVVGVQTVIEKMTNPDLPVGWAMVVVLLAVFSGVQLVAIGMIGEYLGRMFLSQNKKPQYTVRAAYEGGRGDEQD